ncbi:hypothetical protein [Bizionia myxarmorum]|uniref:DUF5103 domain-containing protein n=1 Tax=Bizionia myxarmorum TaxID=291186 RepID=A0A5D0R448_9FLAO|nr:hypothetical protein [Bizionia myxarmorum]TYB76337.1 hypothetical protein ES674_12155 [Bizionia myxarmorum]
MKFLSVAFLSCLSLCVSMCCTGEDDYNYSNTDVRNDSVIQIEDNVTDLQVDDTIYITTTLNNEQISTANNTVLLTNYLNMDSPDNFYYYYLNLYKETAYNTYSLIEISPEAIEVLEGNTSIDSQSLFVRCEFNNTAFINKFGIKLLEPGRYYLAGSKDYYNSGQELARISGNSFGTDYITIYSNIINSDSNGHYFFTVN